jgi:hypothetical protein
VREPFAEESSPYSAEFRAEALRLMRSSGKTKTAILQDLGISLEALRHWLRQAELDAAVGHAPHHHARPLLLGYRVHTLLCRGSALHLLSSSPLPTAMTPSLLSRSWPGPCASTGCARASFGSTPTLGAYASSRGSARCSGRSPSSPGIPSARRIACVCPRPGPPRSWANALVLFCAAIWACS